MSGEQTLRWFIFFTVLFYVLLPKVDQYRLASNELNYAYHALVYLLGLAPIFVLLRAPNGRLTDNVLLGTLCSIYAAIAISIGLSILNWHAWQPDVATLVLKDCKAVIRSQGLGLFTPVGEQLILERPVFDGLLIESKILLDISPAHDGTLKLVDNGKSIRFYCCKTTKQKYNEETYGHVETETTDVFHDFDSTWDGPRNQKKIKLNAVELVSASCTSWTLASCPNDLRLNCAF